MIKQEAKENLLPRGRQDSSSSFSLLRPNYQFYGEYKMDHKVFSLNPIQTIADNENFALVADQLQDRGYTHCRLIGREAKDYYLAYTVGFFERLLQCPYPQEILHAFISFVSANEKNYFSHSRHFYTPEIAKRIRGHFVDIVEVVKMIPRRTSHNTESIKNALVYFYKMISYSKVLLSDMVIMLRNMAGNFIQQKPSYEILPGTVISALILPVAINDDVIRRSVEQNPMAEQPRKHDNIPDFVKKEILNLTTPPHLIVQAVLCKILGFHLRLLEYKFNHFVSEVKETINMQTDERIALFTQQRVIEQIRLELFSFNSEYYVLYRSQDNVEQLTECQLKSKSETESIKSVVNPDERNSMVELIKLNCGACCGLVVRKIIWNHLEEHFPLKEEHTVFEERFFIFDGKCGSFNLEENPRRACCMKGEKLSFKTLYLIYGDQMNRKRFGEVEKRFDQAFPIRFTDFRPTDRPKIRDPLSSVAHTTGSINSQRLHMTKIEPIFEDPERHSEVTILPSPQLQQRRYCRGTVNRCQLTTFLIVISVLIVLIVFFLLNEFKILPSR